MRGAIGTWSVLSEQISVNGKRLAVALVISVIVGIAVSFLGWEVALFPALGVTLILFEVFRIKSCGRVWDFLTLLNAVHFMVYVVAPFHLLTNDKDIRRLVVLADPQVLVSLALITSAYLLLILGYYSARRFVTVKGPKAIARCPRSVLPFGLFTFAVGSFAFALYARVYGGVQGLLQQSDLIRSGFVGDSGLVFFRSFIPFVGLSTWVFLTEYFTTSGLRKAWAVLFIGTGVLLVGLSVLTLAGRSELLFAFLPLLLGAYRSNRSTPSVVSITLITSVVVLWLLVGDSIFASLTYGTTVSNRLFLMESYWRLVNEFTHPFESLIAAVNAVPSHMSVRGLSDLVLGVLSLLPERLLGIRVPETVASFNTLLLTGRFESIIPPGLFAGLYHAFMWPGVLIGSFVYGFFVHIVEKSIMRLESVHPVFAYFYVGFGLGFAYYVMQGDPRVYLQNNLWLILGTVLAIVYLRRGAILK